MSSIKELFFKLYKSIYKEKQYKTKLSRYLFGREIYINLSEFKKYRYRETMNKYYPLMKRASRKYRFILYDLAFSKEYYNCSKDDFFLYDFYHKKDQARKEFITKAMVKEYIHLLNTDDARAFFKNKYKTYVKLKEFYKRDSIMVNRNGYKAFESFCEKHPKFIKKYNNKAKGSGVEIIDSSNHNLKDLFDEFVNNGPTIIEELIVQNTKMKELHSLSVNTIRIITFLDKGGVVKIKYPFLKIGKNNSVVDNGAVGGILALIDEKNGKVKTNGVDESLNWYRYHPNTNIKIKGFQIPDWDEAIKLATKVQKMFKEARLIGWDLAYSDKGWVIVEGNGHTMFVGQQMTDQIGKRKEFEEMIHYDKLKKNKK